MFATLSDPRREKIISGYIGNSTLTPTGLLSQSNREVRPVRNPYPELPLEEALNVSYSPLERTQEKLTPYGYVLDKQLSTQQNKVFVQPRSKKVLFTVAGTDPTSLRDLSTDAYLGFLGQAGLQTTSRYKEAEQTLAKARQKYSGYKKVLSGHSLGSSIINALARPEDDVYGFSTGSGIFPQGGVGVGYRTKYDILSATSRDKTIPIYIPPKKGNLRAGQKVDYPTGYSPHSYQNLRSMPTTFV
jgi:hypothetical protein